MFKNLGGFARVKEYGFEYVEDRPSFINLSKISHITNRGDIITVTGDRFATHSSYSGMELVAVLQGLADSERPVYVDLTAPHQAPPLPETLNEVPMNFNPEDNINRARKNGL